MAIFNGSSINYQQQKKLGLLVVGHFPQERVGVVTAAMVIVVAIIIVIVVAVVVGVVGVVGVGVVGGVCLFSVAVLTALADAYFIAVGCASFVADDDVIADDVYSVCHQQVVNNSNNSATI